MGTAFVIVNKVNGLKFAGGAVSGLHEQMQQFFASVDAGVDQPLFNAIRSEGFLNFKVLSKEVDPAALRDCIIYLVHKYETYKGYNSNLSSVPDLAGISEGTDILMGSGWSVNEMTDFIELVEEDVEIVDDSVEVSDDIDVAKDVIFEVTESAEEAVETIVEETVSKTVEEAVETVVAEVAEVAPVVVKPGEEESPIDRAVFEAQRDIMYPIIKITYDRDIVCGYHSLSEAIEFTPKASPDRLEAAVRSSGMHAGFYWKELLDVSEEELERGKYYGNLFMRGSIRMPKKKYVTQLDEEGNVVKQFDTIDEASGFCDIPAKELRSCIRKKTLREGFYWAWRVAAD